MRLHLAAAALLAACSVDRPGDIVLTGSARYGLVGTAAPAATGSLRVFATLRGEGEYLAPDCPVRAPSGRFVARVDGMADLADNGEWTLRVRPANVRFTTDTECRLDGVTIARIDDVTVRGALVPDSRTCEAFAAVYGAGARTACLRDGTSAIVAEQQVAVDVTPGDGLTLTVELAFDRLERLDGSIIELETLAASR